MGNAEELNPLKVRKRTFFLFRWLLFIWLGADLVYHLQTHTVDQAWGEGLLLALSLSQAVLWFLPAKAFEGMRLVNALFLLDLNLILLGLWSLGLMRADLVMVLFLGIFMGALAERLSLSFSIALVLSLVYLGLRAQAGTAFNFGDGSDLLLLPFLFISCMHSGLLANETRAEILSRKMLVASKHLLSDQLKASFVEMAEIAQDMMALFDALPTAAIMIDRKGVVRICNHMAEYCFGIRRENILRRPLVGQASFSKLVQPLWKCMVKPSDDPSLVDMPPAEGSQAWQMKLNTFQVRNSDGSMLGVLALLSPLSFEEASGAGDPAAARPAGLPDDILPARQAAQGLVAGLQAA